MFLAKMTEKERKDFLDALEDFDKESSTMLGAYDFYQVLGLPLYGTYYEVNYYSRLEILNKWKNNEKLDLAKRCLNTAKATLSNPDKKAKYDENIKKKFINQANGSARFRIEYESSEKVQILERKTLSLTHKIEDKNNEIKELKDEISKVEKKISTHLNGIINYKNDEIKRLKEQIENNEQRIINVKSAQLREKTEINQKSKKELAVNIMSFKIYIAILILITFSIASTFIYFQFYLPNVKQNQLTQMAHDFDQYLALQPRIKCTLESVKDRTVLLNDIDHDGILDGIILATFTGVDCQNIIQSKIYRYDLTKKTIVGSYDLSKGHIYGLKGTENDTLTINRWDLKDHGKRGFSPFINASFHSSNRMFVSKDRLMFLSR